ncbi:MAG: hypothetical protein AAGA30_17605 [Planctomycetota bacterium]
MPRHRLKIEFVADSRLPSDHQCTHCAVFFQEGTWLEHLYCEIRGEGNEKVSIIGNTNARGRALLSSASYELSADRKTVFDVEVSYTDDEIKTRFKVCPGFTVRVTPQSLRSIFTSVPVDVSEASWLNAGWQVSSDVVRQTPFEPDPKNLPSEIKDVFDEFEGIDF